VISILVMFHSCILFYLLFRVKIIKKQKTTTFFRIVACIILIVIYLNVLELFTELQGTH